MDSGFPARVSTSAQASRVGPERRTHPLTASLQCRWSRKA